MRRDERGYIVVETIVAFTLFVFLMASILSLINIVTVQARVHYALTQAAETVSMYSYALDAMGVSDHLMASSGRSDKTEGEVNKFITNVNSVVDSLETLNMSGIEASGEALAQQGNNLAQRLENDPRDVLQNVMNYGLQKAGSYAFDELMRPLVGWYLTNGELSGDAFLKAFRVEGGLDGLSFAPGSLPGWNGEEHRVITSYDSTRLLTSEGDIRIVVSYKIDYSFGALPLPFKDLKVTQEVVTKAWLGGQGEGYPKE